MDKKESWPGEIFLRNDCLKAWIFIVNNILMNVCFLCIHVFVIEHRHHFYDRINE